MAKPSNKVFIATSMDGYIADANGGIDWLDTIPEINTIDTGYESFTAAIDALVMGRVTYETVCGFDIEWPYTKPVYVVSNTITKVQSAHDGKVFLVNGSLQEILKTIHDDECYNLYIDGGGLIQSFLKEDLIDELVITVIPILLGGGTSLFGELPKPLLFECKETRHFLDAIVQNRYVRRR